MRRVLSAVVFVFITRGEDRFYFEETTDWESRTFSPSDWSQVECLDPAVCPGWPTDWPSLTPFLPKDLNNTCHDCAGKTENECRRHQQSPIDLWRNITATTECKDRHRMHFQRGDCVFDDMRFQILPHVLRAHQPALPCEHEPNIDYSWGFPQPWMITHTDVVVPSLHSQDGRHYDAEVVLSHVYSQDKPDKKIGNVAMFLEQGTEDDRYDFLDMYTRRWCLEHNRVVGNCLDQAKEGVGAQNGNSSNPAALPSLMECSDASLPREFHPYDWYIRAKTHYYFRYNGTTVEPPCIENAHWRVLKDPVKVAPSQINTLKSILINRIDPNTCTPYTAARVDSDGSVNVNRPLQTTRPSHRLVYCECIDWESNLLTDIAYCQLSPEERGVVVHAVQSSGPATSTPTWAPSTSATAIVSTDPCDCLTEESTYLCQLFHLIHPIDTPFCP